MNTQNFTETTILLSGSGGATCECWGLVGPGKVHKEESIAQEEKRACNGENQVKEEARAHSIGSCDEDRCNRERHI